MLVAFAGLLAVAAFVILMRLLWLNVRPVGAGTLVAVAAAVLVISLAVLAATGRLSWIAAVGAAVLPFLRRGFGLLRYLPWMRHLFGAWQQSKGGRNQQGNGAGTSGSGMSVAEAIEVLGLTGSPSRDEIIAAHRRLMLKVHPDKGGSNYLARQLNEAKRVLLKQGR
jgi:hypothetical protein